MVRISVVTYHVLVLLVFRRRLSLIKQMRMLTREQAKTQCEAFDYLFESCVKMRQLGIDPAQVPLHGTYRVDNETEEPASKRAKTGFNGAGQADNVRDLASNPTPILPRDGKHLLLDIEGCTTSISFVKDTLFPYVLDHIDNHVNALTPTEYNEVLEALRVDLTEEQKSKIIDLNDCSAIVRFMVQNDLKVASLKSLQGQMWKSGYEKGDIKGHVFADVVPFLQVWYRLP